MKGINQPAEGYPHSASGQGYYRRNADWHRKDAKLHILRKLLAQYQGAVLLFSRTKHNAGKIMRSIRDMGYSAAEIHSNRSLSQRREALGGFKSGKYKVLVATDIAATVDMEDVEGQVRENQIDIFSLVSLRFFQIKSLQMKFFLPEAKKQSLDVSVGLDVRPQ